MWITMDKRDRQDRRSENRQPVAERILWKSRGDEQYSPGWVSDRSQTSVSFVTAVANPLGMDEEIDVVGEDKSCQQFRVTRTSPYGEHFLVACRLNRANARY